MPFIRMRDYRSQMAGPARSIAAPTFVERDIGPETGDADAFLRVIEKEIKPGVEALVPINRSNQALFGHSDGGLAVVHALFTRTRRLSHLHSRQPFALVRWRGGACG